jgi:hypothetical protein
MQQVHLIVHHWEVAAKVMKCPDLGSLRLVSAVLVRRKKVARDIKF